jgi:plastocyanin
MLRRSHRRVLAAPLLAVLVIAVGACGGGGGKGKTKTATNGTIDVGAFDIYYDVTTINASPGKLTVNLSEQGSLPHTFTIASKDFEIKVDSSKKNASGTVDLPAGKYAYVCTTPGHAALMHGTVEVK